MELKLEVLLSSSIKRKKPWPRFCWLGQEKESVFVLDDRRISEINMVSGRTKKKTPKLHPLLNNVVTMASSRNGLWLCGLLMSGELFLWNRDKDLLKTATAVPEVVQMITSSQGTSTKLSLQVSCDGMRVLLSATSGKVFLWECMDSRVLAGLRDGPVEGHWVLIQAPVDTILPSSSDKEASQTTIFVKTEVVGDICLSAFVFTSGENLITTILKIQWKEGQSVGFMRYSVHWVTKKYPLPRLTPPCQPVKSRGALVPVFSPDGQLLAIVLNQRKPQATQVLFVSTQNFISISSSLGGCGCKKVDIPSKYIRSYWVGSVSWSPGGLFLGCMLKRGSLLVLLRLGGLLSLTSSGCSVDFGPAHFLPLHPLVTYRPPMSARKGEASLSSSSMSVRDILRQRYSVTWHPRLFYLIVSDGYMATVMRLPDRPSPALILKTLLKDIRKDLEATSCKLDRSKGYVKAWLDSVCYLNLDSSSEELKATLPDRPTMTDSIISAAVTNGSKLPLFLQNRPGSGGTAELLESVQALFDEESDLDGIPAGSHVRDRGCLEFASMFDTLHALKTHSSEKILSGQVYDQDGEDIKKNSLRRELREIHSRLLTVWAFGLSLGDAVEHRALLLKHLLCCVVQFAALLHLMPDPTCRSGESNTLAFTRLLHLIKALLSFLPWDSSPSEGPRCLRLVVEFSKWIVRLLLNPHPDSHLTGTCQVSSQSLSRIIFLIQMISDSLDTSYTSEQKAVWSSEEESPSQPQVWLSDVYHVHFLQEGKWPQLVKPRPSIRLLGVWQLLYDVIQKYAEELNTIQSCNGLEEEKQRLALIMSQVQTSLQATGEKLGDGPALLNCQGEHLFLSGLYQKSAHAWRVQISQEINKSSYRSVFQETRLCLALLYSLLSQYQLREAQEMGDHMAQLILLRSGLQKTRGTTGSLPCRWIPTDLHSDAASAVVQSLGRFMASYFTNQSLFILPAHNVAVLPPLHLPHGPDVGRLVLLCQEEVARAVRQQHLSEVWTVDYAQDLLLLGGLLPEAVWMAYHLGDWKTAVSLSLAYTCYGSEKFKFSRLRRKDFQLPKALTPESIFQAELECLLKSDSQEHADKGNEKSFTEPLEGEDWDLLQSSIQEILKASVMAGVDIISTFLSSLLDAAKDMCSSLPALVPAGLYLPSPPLYCPQPSPNTQDPWGTAGQLPEVACRQKVSGVLQRLLLLLRSACCCHPAAQWYVSRLGRARHILHKIKKKYAYPSAAVEEKSFPEELMKLIAHGGYFKRRAKKDPQLDSDTIHTIDCFRELCALCWMLHVRDQLSIHCRRFQLSRRHDGDEQSDLDSLSVDALRWARRLLPFSHFLNAEEILQDIVLSLVSDLPPLSMVADTLVETFPEEEESVSVPLREKYNSLLQRLRQCTVLDGVEEEANVPMTSLIQGKLRQRRKHLKRLQRHLTPPVLHLWEKEEDTESKCATGTPRQPSLGTNQGTFSDCEFQPACSDADTAGKTSDTNLSKGHSRSRSKKAKKKTEQIKTDVKIGSGQDQGLREARKKEQLLQPTVGSWEFELEDDEYLHFLELFLSYVLERGSCLGVDSGSELPLLKSFCSELREKELHSLSFDILTTIHRRQKERKHSGSDAPLFRAGACYRPLSESITPELQASSLWTEAPGSRDCLSVSSHFDQRSPQQRGLFGLWKQNSASFRRGDGSVLSSEASPAQNAFTADQLPENLPFDSSASVQTVSDLQQGLDPKLEARFPKLGRLLEWMVRWADRGVPFGLRDKKKKEQGRGAGDGVMIRVRASAPAVLTSLSLLELNAVLGTDRYASHIQVPEVQLTVSPVLQPGEERKLERESSVDTGYPGSAHSAPDQDFHQESISDGDPHTDEPEEHPTFQANPPPADQDAASSPHLTPDDDLNLTPEKENEGGDSECLGLPSSGPREDDTANSFSPETRLKPAEIDLSGKAEEVPCSSISSGHPEAQPNNQPQTLVQARPPDSNNLQRSDPVIDPPKIPPQTPTAEEPTVDSATLNLTSTPSPMRQLLGQDLFRLVQHINYLSLREVIGASFSNLLAQQPSSVAQPDMTCLLPDISSSATRFIPDQDALPNQSTVSAAVQTPVPKPGCRDLKNNDAGCQFAALTTTTSSAANQHQSNIDPQSNVCISGAEYQEMQPLSVQAESPDVQQMENRKRIPSSQGLLATTNTRRAVQSTPVPLSSHGGAQNDSAPPMLGLRLLKFSSPLLSQHTSSQNPPAPQPHAYPTANQEIPRSFQAKTKLDFNKGREDRNTFSSPITRPYKSTSRTFHPQSHSSPQLPPAFPAHTPSPFQGLRLLQLQPPPHHNITFPKLPLPSFSRPSALIPVPVTETPPIKLLQINRGPKVMVPRPVPSTHTTRLISKEELQNLGVGQQELEKTALQLLRVQKSPEKPITSSSCAPNKRHKRREEKAKGGKSEVTFRPNESIIPTQETPALPTSEEPAVVEKIRSDQDIPEPTVDSLTGQKLLGKIFSTSAELQAMASTSKRPPECYDVSTNTDSDCPPQLVDKAISVQASVMTGSPKSTSSANFQIFYEDPVRDGEQQPWQPETNTSPPGRQFLSVLDFEGEDGSPRPAPEIRDVPSIRPSSPTSSQLHVLATSVLRNDFSAVQIPDNCVPLTTPPEMPEESPSESSCGSRSVLERVTSQNMTENLPESEICRAIRNQSGVRQNASPSLLSEGFSSRLSVLDAQLAALQNIADHLETDLVKSRMVVNSLEKLSSPSVKPTKATKKTVRLSLPLQAWTQRPDPAFSAEINASELDKNPTQHDDKDLLLSDEAGASSFHSPPDNFTDADEISHEWTDADPGQSELFDTVELLDELLKEGYLFPTDLDLFESQTVQHNSRQDLQQSGWMSEGQAFSREDRNELRIWMRRKHRERLAAYQKHRARLREQEHKPYTASPSRTRAASRKTRENEEKLTLLEQYDQRMKEAWSLAGEFNLPPGTQASSSRTEGSQVLSKKWSTAAPLSRPHSVSVSGKRGKARLHPQTHSVERPPSEDLHRRLGLHRPVTLLPGDRLSQVTRRGMLSKTLPKSDAASQNETRDDGHQGEPRLNQTYSRGGAIYKRIHRELPKVEGRRELDSSGPHRPQRLQRSDLVLTELVDEEENDPRGVSGIDWLDNLSESADSCLSKIDWAAIERMAAAEESDVDS
ncbi:protein JBTS17 isoform X3 [Oryzias latipes]|uniref:protein JBTS17 isoform X3 n=1 Tax=Oryzias latipes TaxID=8090 RepID=UPI0009DACEA3|nr:protein JBTS17 isoform X3 [Oryzias latipes]